MPIQHIVTCDSCGTSTEDTGWNAEDHFWEPPADWLWLEDGQTDGPLSRLFFCSYVCLGTYVTQKIREADHVTAFEKD